MSVSPDWGKIRLIRVVGAMEKANPNIAPGYAKLRSMTSPELVTAIADKCRHYPCGHILGMEEKYQHEYPMKESLMNNFSEMRRLGMDVFLRNENAK